MPVLLAFIAEDLGFSPSRLVLEDEYVFFRWFRCLTWGGLMEVDRWLLLDQRVKEVSEVSYLFFLLCLFLPLMQRTWECVLIIWAGCRTGTGEVICYLEFAISLYIAFHRVNRQLFPGPLEKCRFKKKKVFEMLPEGKGGFNSVQSLSRVRLSATPWITAHQASLSVTNSRSLPKLMSIKSVMPSNHLILCRPLLLLPPVRGRINWDLGLRYTCYSI